MAPCCVAIVGCGLIGASWAALFHHAGHTVRAWDPDTGARDGFAARVAGPLTQLQQIKAGAAQQGGLTVHDRLEDALRGAVLIQENAPENIPLKHRLYAQIEAAVPRDVIIASSTSAHPWSDLVPGMHSPDRLITAHPFNPPHLVPLVELYGPDPKVVDWAEAFYRGLGSAPVRLKKDAVGHIANRLSSALWREAVHIVAEGIADVDAVDMALVNGPGLRWSVLGAHMAYHLGGGAGGMAGYLEHLGPSQQKRWDSLGSPTLDADTRARLVEGVNTEAAGRSITQLESERDAALIELAQMRQRLAGQKD
ncbi:MAG: 3-hydroxyacyl-CoA dehydrogenase NAD-binding domain-containing protein [Sulfitobacter sp.]|uniref:3-hydroxyacyl-CoA dehydrogenase NAD-binding domain-containing protein n=1 Tax=Sulfitobacter sp. BSw21498 TaxID=664426 RepID=UPI00110FFB45|nr:3-hydroxyacyl-CoA dehydrogenase NAD-binding domain-containing protein [Sulfitobacter sp. BSw21498]